MTDDEKMDALLRQMAAEEYNRPPQIVPREQMWEAVLSGIGNRRVPTDAEQMGIGTAGTAPAAGGQMGTVRPFRSRVPRWVYFAAAAALLLAVGIQLGRLTAPTDRQQARVEPPQVRPDSLGSQAASPESVSVTAPRQDVARNDDGGKGPPKPKGPERLDPDLGNDVATNAYAVAASHHLTEAEAMLTAFKGDLSQGRMDKEIAAWGKELLSNTRLLLDSPAAKDPVRRKLLQDLELVLVQIVQLSPQSSARDRDLIKGALTDDQVLTRLRTAIPVKGT